MFLRMACRTVLNMRRIIAASIIRNTGDIETVGFRGDQRHQLGAGLSPRCLVSLEAIAWALTQAPDVPPQCVSLLIGLANHADSRGRGAYAGQKLLAGYARKSDRSVRNDLGALLERGVIRLGDQSLVAHIPGDSRPVVYDLALERKQASGRKAHLILHHDARKPSRSRG